ncbi:serine/threonine protein kinase [Planctomicrobium sp. SH527]|uniref:serine/threonine protein kinase n=1 Tax=Planctomicrobium sp. SH527 TaxID=3448123 RepID=UPI003F5B76E1
MSQRKIRVRGRWRPYLERRPIRGRDYYLLEQIGSPFRRRYQAFAPDCGPEGDFFLVQRLRADEVTDSRLAVLRRLTDDGFPRVWEWQRHGEDVDLVMSWIEGTTLTNYFENIRTGRRPRLDPAHALRMCLGLASSVCRLHHKLQIGHGDIQPPNIIVTRDPSRLVLIDFSSAWTIQRTAFREEGDGHHRAYAAPELQTPGITPGFAADQFSVSVIFYELLTQQLPYGGLGGKAGRPEYLSGTENSLIPPSQISKTCAGLPRSLTEPLDHIITKGLALDPANRYPGRQEWLDDLHQASHRFQSKPELSTVEKLMTRVMGLFAKSKPET